MASHPYPCSFDRRLYADAWLKLRPSEANVQDAILSALAFRGIPAIAIDVGAKKLRGRAAALALRLGASRTDLRWLNTGKTGAGLKGLVDIIGVIPATPWGRPLFLEVKAPAHLDQAGRVIESAGTPTPDQLAFLDLMSSVGSVVGVLWSPDDLATILPGPT